MEHWRGRQVKCEAVVRAWEEGEGLQMHLGRSKSEQVLYHIINTPARWNTFTICPLC